MLGKQGSANVVVELQCEVVGQVAQSPLYYLRLIARKSRGLNHGVRKELGLTEQMSCLKDAQYTESGGFNVNISPST